MRGRFTPGAFEEEWCERRLLARIHRYTVKRLRAEIEPVAARDFLRFLFEWQRVLPDARMQGPDAVAAVLAQLEGFEAPASAWETDILPARITEYEPEWLDEHCRAGRFVWTRLAAARLRPRARRGAGALDAHHAAGEAQRQGLVGVHRGARPGAAELAARAVMDFIKDHGASFFDEIADSVGMLPVEVEEALAELVALGMVNSDSFGGLRALLVPSSQRGRASGRGGRRKRQMALFAMADAGRWALVRRAGRRRSARRGVGRARRAHAAAALGRDFLAAAGARGGVAAALARHRDVLPPAGGSRRDSRRPLRRRLLGRAVCARPRPWRRCARRAAGRRPAATSRSRGPIRSILLGIVTPGARLPSLAGNRLLYRDGLPIATYAAGEVQFLEKLEPKEEWEARNAVLRRHVPAALIAARRCRLKSESACDSRSELSRISAPRARVQLGVSMKALARVIALFSLVSFAGAASAQPPAAAAPKLGRGQKLLPHRAAAADPSAQGQGARDGGLLLCVPGLQSVSTVHAEAGQEPAAQCRGRLCARPRSMRARTGRCFSSPT